MSNPVLEAIEADDRATAERWAREYYEARFAPGNNPATKEGQVNAMLPLVREMREAVAAASVEQSGIAWRAIGEIGEALGCGEDASVNDILAAARAKTAPARGDRINDRARCGAARVEAEEAVKRALTGVRHAGSKGRKEAAQKALAVATERLEQAQLAEWTAKEAEMEHG